MSPATTSATSGADSGTSSTATPASPKSGAEATRARILAAALQALREDGITNVSARSIARRGGFNQALIFYHFGSLEGLLAALARTESERRSQLYAAALEEVTSLSELVAVARRLHADEFADGNVAALTQMLAGAAGSTELAHGIADALEPWTTLVRQTIERLLSGTPYSQLLSQDDLTSAATAMFLGIELFTGLNPTKGASEQESLFSTMEAVATLVDSFLQTPSD